jgi:hypothetical protein
MDIEREECDGKHNKTTNYTLNEHKRAVNTKLPIYLYTTSQT